MPANKRATLVSKVAVQQNCVVAFVHHVARSGPAALILAALTGSTLVAAADLPQPLSDSSPATDTSPAGVLNRSPALQTNSKVLPVDSAFALQSFLWKYDAAKTPVPGWS